MTEANASQEQIRTFGWIPIFHDAPEQALQKALGNCPIRRLNPGDILLTPGERNDQLFIVLRGEAHVILSDAPHAGSDVITIPPGECLGELSVIDADPASALVQAASELECLCITRDFFWQELTRLPGVARNLMCLLTERIRAGNVRALEAQRRHLELEQLRKDLAIAKRLQCSLLPLQRPLLPSSHPYEAHALLETASSVGGDFFDVLSLENQKLLFCIGDVTGHGIAAALLMTRILGILRTLAIQSDDPGVLLAQLNNLLCQDQENDFYATLLCGVLDPIHGQLTLANGGHCHPLLFTDGRVQVLRPPQGLLLGAFANLAYPTAHHALKPGDVLLAYTDGLSEAESSAGEPLGLERLRSQWQALLSDGDANGAPGLMDQLNGLLAHAKLFASQPALEDDCAMVAIRRR